MVLWMCITATWCSACLLDAFGCVPQLHGIVLVLMVFWMCVTAVWCSACVDGLLDVCHSYMV